MKEDISRGRGRVLTPSRACHCYTVIIIIVDFANGTDLSPTNSYSSNTPPLFVVAATTHKRCIRRSFSVFPLFYGYPLNAVTYETIVMNSTGRRKISSDNVVRSLLINYFFIPSV